MVGEEEMEKELQWSKLGRGGKKQRETQGARLEGGRPHQLVRLLSKEESIQVVGTWVRGWTGEAFWPGAKVFCLR